MQQIPLSQGRFVIVDGADYPLLVDFKWWFRGERDSRYGYAVRHHKVDGRDRLLYLHRLLMNPPAGHDVIFLNFDTLDCRRANLRVVTKQEARQHHRVRSDSKSGVKGVRHNPVAEHECLVMLIERKTTQHTGSNVIDKTRSIAEQLRPL